MKRSGVLFVISAPSGAGKTTLCDGLRQTRKFFYSVSCTTRPPRTGEKEDKDYFFVSKEEFRQRLKNGYFLEHAMVHGSLYGTPIQPVLDTLEKGSDVLLDIDVQGARQIRMSKEPAVRSALVDVFLMTETSAELERRLRKRATDSDATIKRRLAAAREEMNHWCDYSYVILSRSAKDDLQKFQAIVEAEHYRASRLKLSEWA